MCASTVNMSVFTYMHVYGSLRVLSSLEVAAVAECTEYKDPALPPPVNQPSIKHSRAAVFISSSVNQLD